MERFTYFENGKWRLRVGDTEFAGAWVDRLAAYEDTGLEPEEINRVLDAYGRGHTLRTESAERLEIIRDIQTARLREMVQAEKAGRLPKYTIGDTIYDRFGMAWTVDSVEYVQCTYEREWLYRCGHPGTGDYCGLYQDEVLAREEVETERKVVKDNA